MVNYLHINVRTHFSSLSNLIFHSILQKVRKNHVCDNNKNCSLKNDSLVIYTSEILTMQWILENTVTIQTAINQNSCKFKCSKGKL